MRTLGAMQAANLSHSDYSHLRTSKTRSSLSRRKSAGLTSTWLLASDKRPITIASTGNVSLDSRRAGYPKQHFDSTRLQRVRFKRAVLERYLDLHYHAAWNLQVNIQAAFLAKTHTVAGVCWDEGDRPVDTIPYQA